MRHTPPSVSLCDLLFLPVYALAAIALISVAFCVDALMQGPAQGFRTAASMLGDYVLGPEVRGLV